MPAPIKPCIVSGSLNPQQSSRLPGMEAPMLFAVAMNQSDFANPARMLFTGPFLLFGCAIVILVLAGWWKLFVKAGHPGWACLIPFYNIYILLKIAGRPGWWLLLLLIPFVNIVINII